MHKNAIVFEKLQKSFSARKAPRPPIASGGWGSANLV